MIQLAQSKEPKVFAIKLSNISCVNCANNIKKILSTSLSDKDVKISVNIMQQTVNLTVFMEQTVDQAVQILNNTKYIPKQNPFLISGGQENQRSIAFQAQSSTEVELLSSTLKKVVGIKKMTSDVKDSQTKICITYDSSIVKGRQIAQIIESASSEFQVINQQIDAFSQKKKDVVKGVSINVTFFLCIYLMLINMIFPVLPFTKGWFHEVAMFPTSFGIFPFSVLINVGIAAFVMKYYAQRFIKNAYNNYVENKFTNMQTLIALGSLSAYFLSIFFFLRYFMEGLNDQLQDYPKAIMDINDALTSACIIVLVVTIGKHFESKVKAKISKMTEDIFPESTLFANMSIDYIEIKNRKLDILQQKTYDVSLIQKNDIVKVTPGRVLLDLIIISGSVRAIQSANTGCQDIVQLTKGQRLESGSVVHESTGQTFAVVENVLEKTLLFNIGTRIKLSQNSEQEKATGIQATCQKIAEYFVKGVILISLTTVAVWSILIMSGAVEIRQACAICFIIQKGIGVLVASCPCALGLAVPSVMAIVLNLAIKSGVLIKNNSVFQKMKTVKKVAFDKTGTLFTRIQNISEYVVLSSTFRQQLMWQMVAIIEKEIRHPLAQILYKEAFERSNILGINYEFILLQKPTIQKQGISCELLEKKKNQKHQIMIGNKNILQNKGIKIPSFQRSSDASTELFLCSNTEVLMVIMLNTHSNLRPEAKDVITKIRQQGLQVHILSGDSYQSVQKLGTYLEIPEDCLHPQHSAFMKMKWIKDSQEQKNGVIMIGDGLNDIPCLQEASIGVSINAKSELNINAADSVILHQNLFKILAFVRFLKKGNLFIKFNLGWTFLYNISIMPIVAGVFYHWGVEVSPVWSSIAMSLSSIFVVGFSHILSCFKYDESLSKKDKSNIKQRQTNFTEHLQQSNDRTKKYKDEILVEEVQSKL